MGAVSEALINRSINIWKQGGYPWSSYAERAGEEMKAATTEAAKFLTGGSSVSQMEDYLAMIWNIESSVLGTTVALGNNGSGYYGLSQLGSTAVVNWNQKVGSSAKINVTYIQAARQDPALQVGYAAKVMAAHLVDRRLGKISSDGSFTPPATYGIPEGYELSVLYLSVLFPAHTREPNANRALPMPKQAAKLYQNGVVTKASIRKGLCQLAADKGAPVTECGGEIITTGNSSSLNSGGGVGGAGGATGVLRDVNRTLPTTMAEAKVEPGSPLSFTVSSSQSTFGLGGTVGGSMNAGEASSGEINTSLASNGIFVYPVPGVSINSPFGPRWGKLHAGVDMAAPTGTKIYAAASGVVTFAGFENGGYGNRVLINHGPILGGNQDVYTTSSHNSKVLVKKGQKVVAGTVISLMGSTGFSTGPHLHFEIRLGGPYKAHKPLDPAKYLPPK